MRFTLVALLQKQLYKAIVHKYLVSQTFSNKFNKINKVISLNVSLIRPNSLLADENLKNTL